MNTFDRTLASLDADSTSRPWRLAASGVAIILLLGWAAWMFLARIDLFVVSKSARFEVEQAAYPVDAPTDGLLKASDLVLGATVHAGDVLVELDSEEYQLRLAETKARLRSDGAAREALETEATAQATVLESVTRAAVASLDVAAARRLQADVLARIRATQNARVVRLAEEALVSQIELDDSKASAETHRLAADALQRDVHRVQWEDKVRIGESAVKLAELRHRLAEVSGQVDVLQASIDLLEYEVRKRRVVAPVTGTVAESARTQAGAVIKQGQRLGTIVPAGEMRIVAEFTPSDAIGRIRPEQKAILRLDGFPWAHYGVATGSVLHVGSETRDGRVRVDLSVLSTPQVPIQHGLTGTLEVRTESITPFLLLLRALGGHLSGSSESERAGEELKVHASAGPN